MKIIKKINRKKVSAFVSLQIILLLATAAVCVKLCLWSMNLNMQSYTYFKKKQNMYDLKNLLVNYYTINHCFPIDKDNNINYKSLRFSCEYIFKLKTYNNFTEDSQKAIYNVVSICDNNHEIPITSEDLIIAKNNFDISQHLKNNNFDSSLNKNAENIK